MAQPHVGGFKAKLPLPGLCAALPSWVLKILELFIHHIFYPQSLLRQHILKDITTTTKNTILEKSKEFTLYFSISSLVMERSYITSTRNVDSARLSSMLRGKFGRGGYRVEMRHGSYTIYASQRLTEVYNVLSISLGRCTYILCYRAT